MLHINSWDFKCTEFQFCSLWLLACRFTASKQKFPLSLKEVLLILGFPLKVLRLSLQNVQVKLVAQQHIVQTVAVGPSTRTCFFARFHSLIGSPDALRSLCGVDSNVFALLLSLLPADRESMKMKMKLGISFSAVAVLFGVHEKTKSHTFYAVLHTLAEIIKDWIYKPPITDIMLSQPSCFKVNYPQCTLIDCTEMKTETLSEVRQQHMLCSPYKVTYTLKFLVAIIPNGMVVFKSKPYDGRCSDTHITLDSNFFNIIEAKEAILANRGFPGIRTSLADRGVVLIMPPFSAGSNIPFTPEEMEQTYSAASIRIHAERAIKRIKHYNILNHRIPISPIPAMDQIFHMCCVLANLQAHTILS